MAAATGASEAALLDDELAQLKDQGKPQLRPKDRWRSGTLTPWPVATLRNALKVQCSTILAATSTQATARPGASPPLSLAQARPAARTAQQQHAYKQRACQQHAYKQQCAYRIATPVTAFKVHDPDPHAVDGGHVLGLRFEVMSRGHFLRPYYVFLNRPFPGARHLRLHRHTLPPAVPLAGLAARHLPPPQPCDDDPSRQDLDRFVRTLRREVVRYHNRLGVSADLRRRLGLHDQAEPSSPSASLLVEVGIADIEAKHIKLTWADERTGRLVMDDDGNVLKLVVFGPQGRDWETTKALFGKYYRMEDIARKLEEHGAAARRDNHPQGKPNSARGPTIPS